MTWPLCSVTSMSNPSEKYPNMPRVWKKPGTEHGLGVLIALLTLLLLLVFGLSCTRNEFNVDVTLSDDHADHYTFLYFASDPEKGWIVENIVTPEKGKLRMEGLTRNPTVVVIFGPGRRVASLLYAERGDKLHGEAPESFPATWKFRGNELSERLTGWISGNAALIRDGSATAQLDAAVGEYVKAHPEDPASTLLLLFFFDRNSDEPGFRRLWGTLRGEAAKEVWSNLAGRVDMLTFTGKFTSSPGEMVVKSYENGADTLRIGSKPLLLYFSRTGMTGREEDIKALRRISDSWIDSSARVIAEVSLDTDSSSRAWAVRRDSLRKAVHAWLPLGFSDSVAVKLGIGSLPAFIVYDAAGKEIYRGTDREKAAEKFLSTKK